MDGKWQLNEARDGVKPCCGKCGQPFEDGEIGEVKNYPEDGAITVFFKCPDCDEESSFIYKPDKWKVEKKWVEV